MGRRSHNQTLHLWANEDYVQRWTINANGNPELAYDDAGHGLERRITCRILGKGRRQGPGRSDRRSHIAGSHARRLNHTFGALRSA